MIKNLVDIEIKINAKNINHYLSLGYECDLKEIIKVKPSDITKGSHTKIIAICDNCNSEKEISVSKYWQNYNRHGYYGCKKCSNKKRKMTNLKKYGVECVFQKEDIRKHNKEWMLSDEFKEKSKKSLIKNYGVDHYSKTDEFKYLISEMNKSMSDQINEKRKETCLKKYGTKNYMLTREFMEKRSFTMNEKYGATYSTQSSILKEKIKNSFQNKWGVDSPFDSIEIQKMAKGSIMRKYGVENVFELENIKKNIRKTKEELGYQSKEEDISEYKKYKNRVFHLTRKNKKELFDNWDGYDYYDGEYIKDNIKLEQTHKDYPTIDHKISVFYAFNNNISEEEISMLENLCITKRKINSSKGNKNVDIFNL